MRNIALIADDLRSTRDILRSILREALPESFDIQEVETGKEAVQFMQKYADQIAIVLLDVLLPEIDGVHILKIYSDSGWVDCFPVIMITSHDGSEVENVCYKLGVYDFARKPFSRALAVQRIQHAVTLYQYQQDAMRSDYEVIKNLLVQSDKIKTEIAKTGFKKTLKLKDEETGERITLEFDEYGNIQ